jgi:hypothetical protein
MLHDHRVRFDYFHDDEYHIRNRDAEDCERDLMSEDELEDAEYYAREQYEISTREAHLASLAEITEVDESTNEEELPF